MAFLLADPLEQFSIEVFSSYFSFFGYSSSFQSSSWFFLLIPSTSITKMVTFNFILVMVWVYSLKPIFFTNKLQKIILLTFFFIVSILKDSVSITKHSFILLLYTTFMFLCVSNLLGMLPYSMTVTSHLILTLFLSLAFFIGSNIIGVCYHKQSFFSLFLANKH
jgi:F-type H+-transporting ATPase subunit a